MSFQVPPYALHYDDEAEIRDAYWHPWPGDRVIDIGSRYGSYTLPALDAGAYVTAVDPHAGIMQLLRDVVALNGLGDRLTTVDAAVLDDEPYPEQLIAEIDERWPAGHVEFTTLDDIAPVSPVDGTARPVDWIKIDVEGVELQVLQGGLETLKRYHPKLLIEDHTRVYPWCEDNRIRERMHELLEGLGYVVESVPYEPDTGSPRDFTVAT